MGRSPSWIGCSSESDRATLEANADLLEDLDRALAAPGFQIDDGPREIIRPRSSLAFGSRLSDLEDLLASQARLRLESNDIDGAVESVQRLVRLGHRAERSDGPLLQHLGAGSLKRSGLLGLRVLFQRAHPSAARARATLAFLEEHAVEGEALANAVKSEYRCVSECIDAGTISGEDGDDFLERLFTSPNRTRALFADAYRRIAANAVLPRAQRRDVTIPKLETLSVFSLRIPLSITNIAGRAAAGAIVPGALEQLDRLDTNRVAFDATRIIVALYAHRLETGELPETLDALVPSFLTAVPLDPFDGKPLRYSRETRRIWAIGTDLVDEGGRAGDDWSIWLDSREPSIEFEFR